MDLGYSGNYAFYQTPNNNDKSALQTKLKNDFKRCLLSENLEANLTRQLPMTTSRRNRAFERKTARRRNLILGGNIVTRLLMLAACSYYTISFLMDYFNYPTVMTMHKDDKEKAVFPTIILCNVNWIRKSYFCQRAADNDMAAIPWKIVESASPEMRKLCNREPNNEGKFKFFNSAKNAWACDDKKDDMFAKFMLMYDFYMLLPEEERMNASQKSSSFISNCQFNGIQCSHENFTRIKTALFGNNCFRTNFQTQSNSYGFVSGLALMFNVEEEEYLILSEMAGRMGIQAHISKKKNAVPKLTTDIFQISPGRSTFVSMDQINEKRLEAPYIDKCHKYNGDSRSSCLDECWNGLSKQTCNCTDPLANYPSNTKGVCDLVVRKNRCCLGDVRRNVLSQMIGCKCSHSCESVHYALTQSSETLNPRVIRDPGVGLVHFYLRNSYITKYESNPKYRATDFFSNLGGQFGLWLGLSLMDLLGGFYNKVLTKIFKTRDKHDRHKCNANVFKVKHSTFYSRNRSV